MLSDRNIKAVFWDIDGTLVDSEPTHYETLLHCSKSFGVNLDKVPKNRFLGAHLKDVWAGINEAFPPEIKFEDWIERIESYYVNFVGKVALMPNAVETINELALTVKQCAVSNSGRKIVDANLKRLGVENFLEASISFNDVTKGKPDPQPFLLALETLGVSRIESIAVEDSLPGIKSAQSAGLWAVAYRNPSLPADSHIDDLSELPRLLGVAQVQN